MHQFMRQFRHYQSRAFRQRFWTFLPKALALLSVSLCIFALVACEPIPETNQSSIGSNNRLKTVLSRGKLVCGVSGELLGFSFVNKEGKYSGLDVDICRAIASQHLSILRDRC